MGIFRRAGCLIFGKTTTAEFASTTNGPKATANPHDHTRTPGGSSSGSSAAVADFQVPLATGTQTLGSTIRPAAYVGCYSLKPTWSACSMEGGKVASPTNDTMGFFSRSVADLKLVAQAFDLHDAPGPAFSGSLQGARIAVCRPPTWKEHACESTRQALAKGTALLEARGVKVEELVLAPGFDKAADYNRTIAFAEMSVCIFNEQRDGMDSLLSSWLDLGRSIDRRTYLEALDGAAKLRGVFDKLVSEYDAVLAPSCVDEAPVGRTTGSPAMCTIWTVRSRICGIYHCRVS